MPFPTIKGTFSRFSRNKPARTIPMAPAPEPVPQRPTPTQAVTETEAEEQKADETNNVLNPPQPSVRRQEVKKTPKAVEGQELSGHQTEAKEGTENIYRLIWRAENSYNMTPVRYTRVNTFIPNAIPLFQLLEAAERRLESNKHIQAHESQYLPYAVKCYYAIMYYIQILEAKKTAGNLEGDEASLLNRFDKKYPRSSLPCAEIVYGYFNSIVSTELADEKYDWLTPSISEHMFRNHANNGFTGATIHASGVQYLQPHVPLMIATLNTFIHRENIAGSIRNGVFVPLPLTDNHNDKIILGQTFRDNTDTLNDFKPMLQACGMNSPLRFGNQNWNSAQDYARETDFGHNVKLVLTDTDIEVGLNLTMQYIFADLDSFLFMGKRQTGYSNLKWFDFLREHAVTHARFFDQVYHFTDVQTVGGLESTILCKLKVYNDTDSYLNSFYHDTRLGMGQAASWYRPIFRDIIGGFATSRAGIQRNEELQALAYGINSTLPIITRATAATAFTNANNAVGHDLRSGRFWSNSEWIKQYNYANLVIEGKPMYSDFNNVALRCIRDDPHGTGVVDNEL